MIRRWLLPGACLLLAAACAAPVVPVGDAPPQGKHFAVATENATASNVAREVLAEGGNAVDAAVCAALTLGVAVPVSSGIGGGGFAMVWDPKDKKAVVIDFRERAPAELDPQVFDREPPPVGATVGAPGEVQGLEELARRFGKKPLAFCALRAAKLAEDGVPLSPHMARAVHKLRPLLARSTPLAHLAPLEAGDRLANAPLGRTLRAIAERGSKAMTEGPIAEGIVRTVREAGGTLTLADLAANKPTERAPLTVSYDGGTLHTMPAPSGGGLMTAELALAMDADPLRKTLDTPEAAHVVAELLRGAFADRLRAVGDPDASPSDLPKLLDKARLAARRAAIDPNKTRPVPAFLHDEHGTSHLVVVDESGLVVSLTTTVNNAFGARIVTPDGILLNDELMDFVPLRRAKAMGLAGAPGTPRPGARPPSSMCPTVVVRDGRPVLVAGGSGGLRIATGVAQIVLAATSGKTAREAVNAPRFHVGPDGAIVLERDVPKDFEDALVARGETVKRDDNISAVQAVTLAVDATGGLLLLPAADRRKFGLAIAE